MAQTKVGVVIAEADASYRTILRNNMEADERFCIVAAVGSGVDALTAVQTLRPDVLLSAVILPDLDGLGLLERVRKEKKPPKVVLLSSWQQEEIVCEALKHGASYYMAKPCDTKSLHDRLYHLARSEKIFPDEVMEMEQLTVEVLKKLGFVPGTVGTELAGDMIRIAVKKPKALRSVAREIYAPLCREDEKTTARVEHALRYAIERAWLEGDANYQEQLFGGAVRSCSGRPCNKAFLAVVSEHIRNALRQEQKKANEA